MPNMEPIKNAYKDTLNTLSGNMTKMLPYMIAMLMITIAYSISWYVMDIFSEVACVNTNYIIKLLFCRLNLSILGKMLISSIVGGLVIIPFAGIVYLLYSDQNKGIKLLDRIKTQPLIFLKAVSFRWGITVLLFIPFIISIFVLQPEIQEKIIEKGGITIAKMIMISIMPMTLSLVSAFVMLMFLEPLLQYVELDILVYNSTIKQAILRSITLAARYKTSSLIMAAVTISLGFILTVLKYLYTIHPLLVVSLMAALFMESFFIFPIRTTLLYHLWNRILEGKEKEDKERSEKEYQSYLNKMMLG